MSVMFFMFMCAADLFVVMMFVLSRSDYNTGFDRICHFVDLCKEFIGYVALYSELLHREVQNSRLNAVKLAYSIFNFCTAVSTGKIFYSVVI